MRFVIITHIGVDIFGILSKSGGPKSLSLYLIINTHYTLEKLDLMRFSNRYNILIEILTNFAEFVLPSRNKFVHFIIEVKKKRWPAPPKNDAYWLFLGEKLLLFKPHFRTVANNKNL